MERDRLLIFGNSAIPKHTLLTLLGEETPAKESIQTVTLSTKYYTTSIDIWLDDSDELKEWCDEYSSVEAKEVREVLNGLVYCFSFGEIKKFEKQIEELKLLMTQFDQESGGEDDEWEGLKVCVGFGELECEFEEYEDICFANGWECIQLNDDRGVNEFKERVGGGRFKEVIESHGWTITDEKTTNAENAEEEVMDLEQMVSLINNEKERIAQLPDAEREREAAKFIESLNLS